MEKWKNTTLGIVEHILGQHPEIVPDILHAHRALLSTHISNFHKNSIAYGPLKGFQFDPESHWGSADRAAMILGLYEQDVLNSLLQIDSRFVNFIDLGAADGYYGVGLLVNNIFKKSYCFEISEKGQEIIKKNSRLNNVADRVVIKGEARKDFYKDIPLEDLKNSVLFIDIEGAEFDILDDEAFKIFKDSIVFIELHDWLFNDGDRKLNKLKLDANNTHSINELTMSNRDLSNFDELKSLNDTDRWLLCSEGRPRIMTWLRLDPKHES